MSIAFVNSNAVGFADGNGGHVYTIPSGTPATDDLDILCINSNTVVSTVASAGGTAWSKRVDATNNQGAYIYTRKATSGEGSTVTITTSGNHNTSLIWCRLTGTNAYSSGNFARTDNSNGTTLPALTTGTLAETAMAVIGFGALHNFDGTLASSPVWTNGFTDMGSVSQGSAGSSSAVVGMAAYKLNVGTASEDIGGSLTWTNNARNRYALYVTVTAVADSGFVRPTLVVPTVAVHRSRSW
jgi:hypothetical protein